MKSTKQRTEEERRKARKCLFKRSRPFVRPFNPEWNQDMWVMWAAYDLGSFQALPAGLSKQEFATLVMKVTQAHSSCTIIEDDCRWFKSGRGPVAFVTINNDGWTITPQADYFMWATPRIRLRAAVCFLHMSRHSESVGIVLIKSMANTVNFFHKMKRYLSIMHLGRMIEGDARGDTFFFWLRGKKEQAAVTHAQEKAA